METIDKLRELLPDVARDIKINLQTVLTPGALNATQLWGTALACAYSSRTKALIEAVREAARAAQVGEPVLEDARAAAVLMAMNNVYYRFRHLIGSEEYAKKPARLRMQRLNQTENKADFELFCLAVSAINNCQACVQAHEAAVLEGGLTTDQVHDAVRIAATINAAAVGLAAAA
jgi:alkyl hydroperoxide reductase subunit D